MCVFCFFMQFLCGVCQKRYTSKQPLRAHLWTKHKVGRPLQCRWCDRKSFSNYTTLYNYQKLCGANHPDNKPGQVTLRKLRGVERE